MKCYEGAILSVDGKDGVYKYLVEDKGRIVFVGDGHPGNKNGLICAQEGSEGGSGNKNGPICARTWAIDSKQADQIYTGPAPKAGHEP